MTSIEGADEVKVRRPTPVEGTSVLRRRPWEARASVSETGRRPRTFALAASVLLLSMWVSACEEEKPTITPDATAVCKANAYCTEASASKCDVPTGACVACAGDGDCSHIAGKGVCNAGSCVQCTVTNESACGGRSCVERLHACSSYEKGAQDACKPCDTDANCVALHACIGMTYQGAMRPTGYCLKRGDAAGGCEQPFTIPLSGRTSLDGAVAADYCGINEQLTTCEAVQGLVGNAACPNGTDAECPEPGGLCRKVGLTANRCTYRCGAVSECLASPTAGSTCGPPEGMPSGEKYCGGKM